MGDSAGEQTNRFHFLRLEQFLFALLKGGFGTFALVNRAQNICQALHEIYGLAAEQSVIVSERGKKAITPATASDRYGDTGANSEGRECVGAGKIFVVVGEMNRFVFRDRGGCGRVHRQVPRPR